MKYAYASVAFCFVVVIFPAINVIDTHRLVNIALPHVINPIPVR